MLHLHLNIKTKLFFLLNILTYVSLQYIKHVFPRLGLQNAILTNN